MPSVVVLGVGLQGRATVHDLSTRPGMDQVVAVDLDPARVRAALPETTLARVTVDPVDATQESSIRRVLADHRPDVVIGMLPPVLGPTVARLALEAGAHYVCTSYTGELVHLDGMARERGLAVLPELGMDPGIDLVLAQLAVSELDEVVGLEVFGGGLPEPACADDNPLRYKVTWTLEGVLNAYVRPARLLHEGREQDIQATEIFHPAHTRHEDVPGLGRLEVYPNGDAVAFIERFELGPALQEMGRYSLRWPGHCALWYPLVQLGLLGDDPVDGCGGLTARQLLARQLEPQLQLGDDERDVIALRVRAWGRRDGQNAEVTYDVVDYRDLDTGLYAMNRTVGFPAAIGARFLLDGTIPARGVLSPARDVPPLAFIDALRVRGIEVTRG